MKYTHVIYTSSEKTQSGEPGFGIRLATEGLPQPLLTALEENETFAFTEAGPHLSAAALASNPEAIRLIVPTYFFRLVTLPDRRNVYVLGRKIAIGFDHLFYLEGKTSGIGNYVVDSYIFDTPPTANEFEILLEKSAAGSNRFIPHSPVPSPDNKEISDLLLGEPSPLPVEEKSFSAAAPAAITPQVVNLLFAFIRSRKEGKPVLAKSDVQTPPAFMAALARLVPRKQIENITFISNHTDEGKKRGVNIYFVNEYYNFEIIRKQWIWVDLESTATFISPEAELFRDKVDEAIEKGDLEAVHNLVGWCLSDMYEKGKGFEEQTRTQLYNYLYNFADFDIKSVASDRNLRQTLNEYFIAEPEEKVRFDEELQRRFHSLKTLNDLWEWIDLVLALNPIDTKGLIERNSQIITPAVFSSPKSFLEFYNRYRNRFGDVQKFIDRQAFSLHEDFLSDEVVRPVWQQLYPFFLKARLEDENKDFLVERMIHDNLDQVQLQQVLNKERIDVKEYINCLVTILAKHDPANEEKVADMLASALKDRNDIELDFFTRFPDKIADRCYTALYEWQLRNYSLHTKENVDRLTEYLLTFLHNPSALSWAADPEGSKVFVRLYMAIKELMKRGSITSAEVIRLCDDLRESGYPRKNIEQFEILNTIGRHEEVRDTQKIRKIWEVASQIDDREYLKTLIRAMSGELHKRGDEAAIEEFAGFLLDRELMERARLWDFASKTPHPRPYRKAIIRKGNFKPQEAVDFLTGEGGLTDEDALTFLASDFPKIHEEIMIIRKPTMAQRVKRLFRSILGNKDD